MCIHPVDSPPLPANGKMVVQTALYRTHSLLTTLACPIATKTCCQQDLHLLDRLVFMFSLSKQIGVLLFLCSVTPYSHSPSRRQTYAISRQPIRHARLLRNNGVLRSWSRGRRVEHYAFWSRSIVATSRHARQCGQHAIRGCRGAQQHVRQSAWCDAMEELQQHDCRQHGFQRALRDARLQRR
jgi:hypothetical protein